MKKTKAPTGAIQTPTNGSLFSLAPKGPEVLNTIEETRIGLITNTVNQSSLQMIEVLEFCKDQLPETAGKAGGKGK